jgi:benzodiazapine receptor
VTGRYVAAGAGLLVVLAYAVLPGLWVGHDPGWYASLTKPAWQPPDVVFGVMWPLNFLALAVAVVVVALRAEPVRSMPVLVVLGLSVGCALGWAYTFYVPHSLGTSATLLSSAAVLTWVLLALSARAVPWTGWLLTPYALWMTVATSLAVGFWRLGGARG